MPLEHHRLTPAKKHLGDNTVEGSVYQLAKDKQALKSLKMELTPATSTD